MRKQKKTGELLVDLRGLAAAEQKPGAIIILASNRRFRVVRLTDKAAVVVPVPQ